MKNYENRSWQAVIPRQEHQENNVIADLIWMDAEKSLILASPKLLTLGYEKKNKFSFCISLVYS